MIRTKVIIMMMTSCIFFMITTAPAILDTAYDGDADAVGDGDDRFLALQIDGEPGEERKHTLTSSKSITDFRYYRGQHISFLNIFFVLAYLPRVFSRLLAWLSPTCIVM
jgi:hypothetical protein